MSRRLKFRVGRRFGRLVAREDLGVDSRHSSIWRFECDCGSIVTMRASNAKFEARHGWGCCWSCLWCIRAAGEPSARQIRAASSSLPVSFRFTSGMRREVNGEVSFPTSQFPSLVKPEGDGEANHADFPVLPELASQS